MFNIYKVWVWGKSGGKSAFCLQENYYLYHLTITNFSMKLITEFKEFAMKGNVLDMAVGVIIGIAFGKIVTSVVEDLLMPVVGVLTGGVDFTSLSLKVGDATVKYGNFVQSVFDFLIVSSCIFLMMKGINKLKKAPEPQPEAPAEPSAEEKLLTEIRDLLKDRK